MTSMEPEGSRDMRRARMRTLFARLRVTRRLAARLKAMRRRRVVLLGLALLAVALLLFPAAWLVYHVYFDRTGMPDLEAFIRFEPPTTGVVRDAHGKVLIELAREYRRVVTYDEVPLILRQAILAAEDNRFFSHSGVDYRALPRVIQKTAVRSVSEWWKGGHGFRLLLPQGGSTLTQQLVRGYFLQVLTSRTERGRDLPHRLAPPRVLSAVLGASAMNKLLRKMEEVRLTLWLEQEMRRRYGSHGAGQARDLRALRELHLPGQRPLRLCRRVGVLLRQRPVELHGRRRGQRGAAGRDQQGAAGLRPGGRQPSADHPPQPDSRPDGAQRVHPGEPRDALPGRTDPRGAPAARSRPTLPPRSSTSSSELAQHGGTRFGIEDLFQGRIVVRSTIDARVQAIVNDALEHGLAQYEKRHPKEQGLVQGSVVVLGNADAAILAEAGGRRVYGDRASALLRLQPRHGLAAPARLRDEAAGVPGRVRVGPRISTPRCPTSPSRCRWGTAAASSGSPTTTTSSRARFRCGRPWPSRATPWPCGSRLRSA